MYNICLRYPCIFTTSGIPNQNTDHLTFIMQNNVYLFLCWSNRIDMCVFFLCKLVYVDFKEC